MLNIYFGKDFNGEVDVCDWSWHDSVLGWLVLDQSDAIARSDRCLPIDSTSD